MPQLHTPLSNEPQGHSLFTHTRSLSLAYRTPNSHCLFGGEGRKKGGEKKFSKQGKGKGKIQMSAGWVEERENSLFPCLEL